MITLSLENRPLRPFQKDALQALQRPGHLIVIAPTGSGKSLIYEQYLKNPGTKMLLITPLVALSRQQHRNLLELGIVSKLGTGEGSDGPPLDLKPHESGVWIVSPEKLFFPLKKGVLQLLEKWSPNFLVVDECHCFWEWGRHFRPAFLEVPKLIEIFQIPRSLWLTATLPQKAHQALKAALPLPQLSLGSFELPTQLELYNHAVSWPQRSDFLMEWVRVQPNPGIIFVPTRNGTERVSRLLSTLGRTLIPYHAGMSIEERQNLEALIQTAPNPVIVATSAFGMGMHFSQLTWCLLWQAPLSLLSLAQAVGRVGRGSQGGRAFILWDRDDFQLIEWSARGSAERREDLQEVLLYLQQKKCRKAGLKEYFDTGTLSSEPSLSNCGQCDWCRGLLETPR